MSRSFIARSKKNLKKTFSRSCFAKNHVPRAVSVPFFLQSTESIDVKFRPSLPLQSGKSGNQSVEIGLTKLRNPSRNRYRHFLSRSFVSVCFLVFNERRRLVGRSWNLKWRPRPFDGTSGANRSRMTIGLNRFRSSFKSLPLSEFRRKGIGFSKSWLFPFDSIV